MKTLNQMLTEYVDVHVERLRLEKKAKELETGREKELQEMIMTEMSAQGIKSANVEGVCRVERSTRKHYEIRDVEALARKMLELMVQAGQRGGPLSDGLLLQNRSRLSKANVELVLGDVEDEKEAAALGVALVEKNILSVKGIKRS